MLVAAPAFIFFSKKGPGSAHAPIVIALIAGLIVGILAQRTRLCMVGGIRDLIMFKDSYLISGFISIFIFALIGNLIIGKFKLGFVGQPVAHTDALWNFLGMVLAGWGIRTFGRMSYETTYTFSRRKYRLSYDGLRYVSRCCILP